MSKIVFRKDKEKYKKEKAKTSIMTLEELKSFLSTGFTLGIINNFERQLTDEAKVYFIDMCGEDNSSRGYDLVDFFCIQSFDSFEEAIPFFDLALSKDENIIGDKGGVMLNGFASRNGFKTEEEYQMYMDYYFKKILDNNDSTHTSKASKGIAHFSFGFNKINSLSYERVISIYKELSNRLIPLIENKFALSDKVRYRLYVQIVKYVTGVLDHYDFTEATDEEKDYLFNTMLNTKYLSNFGSDFQTYYGDVDNKTFYTMDTYIIENFKSIKENQKAANKNAEVIGSDYARRSGVFLLTDCFFIYNRDKLSNPEYVDNLLSLDMNALETMTMLNGICNVADAKLDIKTIEKFIEDKVPSKILFKNTYIINYLKEKDMLKTMVSEYLDTYDYLAPCPVTGGREIIELGRLPLGEHWLQREITKRVCRRDSGVQYKVKGVLVSNDIIFNIEDYDMLMKNLGSYTSFFTFIHYQEIYEKRNIDANGLKFVYDSGYVNFPTEKFEKILATESEIEKYIDHLELTSYPIVTLRRWGNFGIIIGNCDCSKETRNKLLVRTLSCLMDKDFYKPLRFVSAMKIPTEEVIEIFAESEELYERISK